MTYTVTLAPPCRYSGRRAAVTGPGGYHAVIHLSGGLWRAYRGEAGGSLTAAEAARRRLARDGITAARVAVAWPRL